MGRILAAIASFSPPNPLDFSGSGAGSESGDGSGNKSQIQIVAFSLVGIFFLIFLVIIWAKCNGCKTKNAVKNDKHDKEAVALASKARKLEDERKLRRYTVEDLTAFTENYKERLGAGAFGEVFKGKFHDGKDIAVKLLKLWPSKNGERLDANEFTAEVESMKNLHHRNVVKLLGFCYETANTDTSIPKIALVFEYMQNGSLDKYLSRKRDEIEFEKLYGIAIGTAKGLAYLHEDCLEKIIHFDIKPANILLDSKFTPKVGDFGLAMLYNMDATHISLPEQMRGTPGYVAPEVTESNKVTSKCDVYSFGIVLFKMVEVKRQNKNNSKDKNEPDWFPVCVRDAAITNKLEEFIGRDCGISGESDKDKAIKACKVGLLCVQAKPSSRPLMSQVVRMLERADPIKLPQSWPFQKNYPISTLKKNRKGFKVPG